MISVASHSAPQEGFYQIKWIKLTLIFDLSLVVQASPGLKHLVLVKEILLPPFRSFDSMTTIVYRVSRFKLDPFWKTVTWVFVIREISRRFCERTQFIRIQQECKRFWKPNFSLNKILPVLKAKMWCLTQNEQILTYLPDFWYQNQRELLKQNGLRSLKP